MSKRLFAIAPLWVLILSPAVHAEEPIEPRVTQVSVAGVQVAIDANTGKLRAPTAAQSAALAEQFRLRYLDNAVDQPTVYNADGSLTKKLGPNHRMYSVARLGADGNLETACLSPDKAAEYRAQSTAVSTDSGTSR